MFSARGEVGDNMKWLIGSTIARDWRGSAAFRRGLVSVSTGGRNGSDVVPEKGTRALEFAPLWLERGTDPPFA